MGSTEFLKKIAELNLYILFERGSTSGHLKKDIITLKMPHGSDAKLSTSQGYVSTPVELPLSTFNDLINANYIEQDGLENNDKRIFRITVDGLAAAKKATDRAENGG